MKVPSITRVNHRYRGPMEQDKHILTMHQILHDIRDLYYTQYRNDILDQPGQRNFISHNMERTIPWWRMAAGDTDTTYSNINPAVTFKGPDMQYSMQFIPTESLPPTDTVSELRGIKARLHDLRQRAGVLYEQL